MMGRKNGVFVNRCMCSRNHGGKKVICKKRKLSALSGFLGHFKSEFLIKKVSGNFSDYEERQGEKKTKKKKKKNFLKDVFPCGFPISGDKKGGKVSGFVFFP